jgi:ribosomal protein S24E
LSLVEILEDSENRLLGRRELHLRFKAGNGLLTRQGAVDAIASKVGVNKDNVKVISLYGSFGVRDVDARAYIFSEAATAKEQLADYVILRHLSKDERKKVREDRKKAATANPATAGAKAPAAENKT